jgi:hypothetical protein
MGVRRQFGRLNIVSCLDSVVVILNRTAYWFWSKRLLIAILLSPIPGVILAVWIHAIFGKHAPGNGVAWDHPLYLIGATLAAIIFVYLSGGRGWEPSNGFYPMYGWLAVGVIVNLIILAKPWRAMRRRPGPK